MNVTLRKIGNSDGVIIPKEMLEQLKVQTGDTLVLTADKDGLRLTRSTEDPEVFEKKMRIARERMKKHDTAYHGRGQWSTFIRALSWKHCIRSSCACMGARQGCAIPACWIRCWHVRCKKRPMAISTFSIWRRLIC